MSDLLNNKTQLQKLLATLSRKKANGTVTSVNGKSGDVVTEMADLGVTVETWTFELEDGTTVDKDMVFYTETALITFYIDDISYQAEEGMTWAEWCNSKYNTDEYSVRDDDHYGEVHPKTSTYMAVQLSQAEYDYVKSEDLLIPNFGYITLHDPTLGEWT